MADAMTLGPSQIDFVARTVSRDGESVPLTPMEFALLHFLADRPGEVVTRETLERTVWGFRAGVRSRAVAACMQRLRAKLERDPSSPDHLQTVRGVGYRLVVDDTEPHGRPAPPSRVPATWGPFVGRESELSRLVAEVRAHRLVTVAGPGGVGKTRLVLEALPTLSSSAWDVTFCDLVPARTAAAVSFVVARALGLSLDHDAPNPLCAPLARLGPHLLVLDNLEQVAEQTVERIEAWLRAAPGLHVLTTSRATLDLPGERVFVLDPLSEGEAITLYRMHAEGRGGAPSDEDDRVLPELVRLLDHLPLAIQLAAARTRVLAPRQLLGRLSERFRLLRVRGGPDRHRSLRATLDWSWDLLEPDEQASVAQLSVFEGGFTLEAAEAVLDLGPEGAEVVDRLIHRSWLTEPVPGRFGQLVHVHAYAAERLTEPSGNAARARHASYYAVLGRRGGIDPAELDNLVVACRTAVAQGSVDAAMATLSAAWSILEHRGPDLWLELAEPVVRELDLGPHRRSIIEMGRGQAYFRKGNLAESGRRMAHALDLVRQRNPGGLVEGRIRLQLGNVLWARGQLLEARASLERALHLVRTAESEHDTADVQTMFGPVLAELGDPTSGIEVQRRALETYRGLGSRMAEGRVLGNLGRVAHTLGRFDEAEGLLRDAHAAMVEVGASYGAAYVELGLAELLLSTERNDEARALCTQALAAFESLGGRSAQHSARVGLGRSLVRDDPATAEREFLTLAELLDVTECEVAL
ncbi:MAG: winged helix-turn-helix domain-containing protein [Myxococcota bacterium]